MFIHGMRLSCKNMLGMQTASSWPSSIDSTTFRSVTTQLELRASESEESDKKLKVCAFKPLFSSQFKARKSAKGCAPAALVLFSCLVKAVLSLAAAPTLLSWKVSACSQADEPALRV